MWYLYIVRCRNNALYTGITTNVKNRLKKHNSHKGSKSIIAHGTPVKLVYLEQIDNYSDALKKEAKIKNLKKKQKELIIKKHTL